MKNLGSAFKNKKGNLIDIIFIIISLIIIGLSFFFIKYSFDDINTELLTDDSLSDQSKAMLQQGNNNYTGWSDYTVGFVFFGLLIGILITSYLIDTHPVFFVLSLILFVFVLFAGVEISNGFQEIVADSDLVDLQDDYPITMFIVENLVMILIGTFVLMSIIIYSKSSSGGGNSYQ